MKLAGLWPWNTPMVAGTTFLQAYGYSGQEPDEDAVKLQDPGQVLKGGHRVEMLGLAENPEESR